MKEEFLEIKEEFLEINGIKYIREPQWKPYVIVRTYSAGVFAGYLDSRNGTEVVLTAARRLWYWKGAASLSQLAVDGVSCPDECKFPVEVNRVELFGVVEILSVTEKAKKSIGGVKVWTA